MNELVLNQKDLLVMNLVNYFMTDKNYNPIIVHGVKDEIWLENMESDYKIIRIVTHYIHNDEQLSYDKFKLKKVVSKLKTKTLSLKMPVLNIYTDLGDAVNSLENDSNYFDVFVKKISDIKKKPILEVFPDILEKTKHEEKGIDLFVKISENINKNNIVKNNKLEKLFAKKNPLITYIIMLLCVILFFGMYIFGNGSEDISTLLLFGANVDVLVKNGQIYRLITSMFLHIGIFHLICNMYALYIIGPQVESFFGKLKFLFIYLISGISGSILSIAFSTNTVSAGASGAIFGLLGAMLYFGYHYRSYLGNVLRSQIVPIIVMNLILGFALTGVDNAAHIGGLVGGVLAASAVRINDKESTIFEKISNYIVLIIYIGFISYLVFMK